VAGDIPGYRASWQKMESEENLPILIEEIEQLLGD